MNIVLFTETELDEGLPATDDRVQHVRNVLRRADGASFDAGVINGHRGKATLEKDRNGMVRVVFQPTGATSDLYAVDVVIGMSRPQTCRYVLRALSSMGVRSIEFVLTDTGEKSYVSSQLWVSGEYQTIVKAAVSQAFETKLPRVEYQRTLAEVLAGKHDEGEPQLDLCLDNYEASTSLAASNCDSAAAIRLLIGSERGWSDPERQAIRDAGFCMAHLGRRVLRVETAAVAGVSTLLAQQFWIHEPGTHSTRPI